MGLIPQPEHDAIELAELLPAPNVSQLRADRQRLLKEHLMSETSIPIARPPRRRLVLAAAAALAIATVVAIHPWSQGQPTVEAAPAVVTLLDHAAAAASTMPVPRSGQFIYVAVYGHYAQFNSDGPVTILPNQHRQDWTSADGSKEGQYVIDSGTPMPLDPFPAGRLDAPTYKYLATLPTEPGALFGVLKANAHSDLPANEEEFSLVGGIADEVIVPPKLAAGLFGATKQIDGVFVAGRTTDALGRPVIALAQIQKNTGIEMEVLFDPTTYVYMGAKEIATKTVEGMTKGQVIGDVAVEKAGLVDNLGDVPTRTA